MVPLDPEEDDLSYWEFINNSDAEFSDDSLSVDSLPDDIVPWDSSSMSSSSPPLPPEIVRDSIAHLDLDGQVDDHDIDTHGRLQHEALDHYGYLGYPYDSPCENYGYGNHDQEEEQEEVDDDYGYDFDDELVPRYVSGKLGRQRMRKLGKRAFSKVTTSKRSPYSHVKPGCLHGKHGLGMKFRC